MFTSNHETEGSTRKNIGLLAFTTGVESPNIRHTEILSKSSDLVEAAANLYGYLHCLNSLDMDIIVAQRFPDEGLGKSINDRLERAVK